MFVSIWKLFCTELCQRVVEMNGLFIFSMPWLLTKLQKSILYIYILVAG